MAQDELHIKEEHIDYEVPLLPLVEFQEGIESNYDPMIKQEFDVQISDTERQEDYTTFCEPKLEELDYEFIEYENDNKEFKLPLPTTIDSTSEVEKVEGKQKLS